MVPDIYFQAGVEIVSSIRAFVEFNDETTNEQFKTIQGCYESLRKHLGIIRDSLNVQFREQITPAAAVLEERIAYILSVAKNALNLIEDNASPTARQGIPHLKTAYALMETTAKNGMKREKALARERFSGG